MEDVTFVKPMNGTEDGAVTGFMCLVDFECELGAASGGNRIFPSERDLREHKRCVEHCGIVEVEVRFKRVVAQPNEAWD